MSRRCIVIDLDRCSGCDTCTVACKYENNVSLGNYRCHVQTVRPAGVHPDIDMYWVPFMCQQCEDAPCIEVCPTGASYRDESNGVVLIDEDVCIGCKSCLKGCPFSSDDGRSHPSARWFNAELNTVEKCTLCNHITAESDGNENGRDSFDPAHAVPPCVHNCSCGARHFGDLDDPDSNVSRFLAEAQAEGRPVHRLEGDGATPSTCYVLSDSVASWRGLGL